MPRLKKRRTRAARIRRLIWAAAAAAALVVCAALIAQEFLVFTPEGIRFALPGRADDAAEPPDYPDYTRDDTATPEISVLRGELPPQGAGELAAKALDVRGLSRSDLLSAAVNLKNLGYGAAVVTYIPPLGAPLPDGDLALAAEVCQEAGLRLVAYIACFKNDAAARAAPERALTVSGGELFVDYSGAAWLDPRNDGARNSVGAAVSAAQSLGANEIILDFLMFPSDGDTSGIDYGGEDTDRIRLISDFLNELRERTKTRLGAVLYGDDTLGEGASEEKGQDAAAFSQYCDRLWVSADTKDEAEQLCRRLMALSAEISGMAAAAYGGEFISAGGFFEN